MGACAYCETCGVQGHTTVECYNAPSSVEHVNAFHNFNPPPQNNPHSLQLPGCQYRASYTPPPPPLEPMSHLKSLMEQFIVTQTKTNEALNASISQLGSKFDAMAAHHKAMDTQIAQIAQQVSHLSRPQGQLPPQPETNPRAHVNVISAVGEGLEESPIMVLQETAAVPHSAGAGEQKGKGDLSPTGKSAPPIHPYQPPAPYPQKVAWAHLFHHEPKFAHFLDALKRIYADTPFLEALREAPAHLKFLRELLSRKGEPEKESMVPIGEACSAILQSQCPPKLQDPGSFSIPCYIGDVQIERALCDLGAGVSLLPLSLCKTLRLPNLRPTTTLIQLADCSIRQPAGILEDIPVQVGKFVIPCDFFVIDMDENSPTPLILGRPFLATAGAVIDVQAGTLSFQLCGERVDFCFPPPTPLSVPTLPSPSEALPNFSPSAAIPGAAVLDAIWESPTLPRGSSSFSMAMSTYSGPIAVRPGEVEHPISHFYTSLGTPPTQSPSTIWR